MAPELAVVERLAEAGPDRGRSSFLAQNRIHLLATLLFAEQCKPPVYVSKTTLQSWIHNPKYGVNTQTWRLDENTENICPNNAGRRSVLDQKTLQFLEESLTTIRNDIGARINVPIAQSIIKKLLYQENKGHLIGDGPGQLKISNSWTRSFLADRLKWRYKAVTSCTKFLPSDWEAQRDNFVLQLAFLVRLNGLTEEDVYNIDETAMLYNPTGKSKTWNASGKIAGTDNYHPCEAYDHGTKDMITLVCAITASGDKLPLQCIFGGKQYKEKKNKKTGQMEKRLDSYGNPIPQFGSCPMDVKPEDASFVQTSNHWGNAETTFTFFNEIVMKHADKRPRKNNATMSYAIYL